MLTEKDLLLEIIHLAPINSVWHISRDSWEKIGFVLNEQIASVTELDWLIIMHDRDRSYLIEKICAYELFAKIVNMSVISEAGDLLFVSYDRMVTSLISSDFPQKAQLMIKYKDSDLILEGNL